MLRLQRKDWHVAEGDGDCDDEVSLLVCCPSRAQVVTSCQDQDPMVFQEEQPSKFQEPWKSNSKGQRAY